MKRMIAAGCSFTDKDFKSNKYPDYDCSFPKWPEIVGNKLGMEVLNLGLCGVGNDYIVNAVIDHILNNFEDVDVVMIGWTEVWRFTPYEHFRVNPPWERKTGENGGTDIISKESLNDLVLLGISRFGSSENGSNTLPAIINNFYTQILRIQKICELFNIQLIHYHLCGSLELHAFKYPAREIGATLNSNRVNHVKLLTSLPNFYEIDKSKSIGYPFIEDLGGHSYDRSHSHLLTKIGERDFHPNAEGHEDIAEIYCEHYKKIYL